MSIYENIREKLNDIAERQTAKIKKRFEKSKTENEYWEKMGKAGETWRTLMSDPRYPEARRFLDETRKQLIENQQLILSGSFNDYTREKRADMAAIVAGQIVLLDMLQNEPERVIDLLKERNG